MATVLGCTNIQNISIIGEGSVGQGCSKLSDSPLWSQLTGPGRATSPKGSNGWSEWPKLRALPSRKTVTNSRTHFSGELELNSQLAGSRNLKHTNEEIIQQRRSHRQTVPCLKGGHRSLPGPLGGRALRGVFCLVSQSSQRDRVCFPEW